MEPCSSRPVVAATTMYVAVVLGAGLIASARRWAVGINGSAWPWDWDTYGTVLSPMVLIAVHLGASVGLGVMMLRPAPR
jgi:hypothetical protein